MRIKTLFTAVSCLLLTTSCLLLTVHCSAQAPETIWENTIGGTDYDQVYSLIETSDGGFIFAGESDSDSSGDKTEDRKGAVEYDDYWIVKTDGLSNILWQNTIGGSLEDNLRMVRQTTDGGYILGGFSTSKISVDKTENNNGPTSTADYWVIKLDAMGDIIWQNTIGGDNEEELRCAVPTSDGGYILGGSSNSNISGDKTQGSKGGYDYWIIKLDSIGNISWQRTFGGSQEDRCRDIHQTGDGGFIIGGYSFSGISGNKTEANISGGIITNDYWIIKINELGGIEWQKTIGGTDNDYENCLALTADGGYIVGGHSISPISGDKTEASIGGYDFWIVKLNATGTIQWQNTIGGNSSEYCRSIIQTADAGYLASGFSFSGISGDKTEHALGLGDYWMVKMDTSGNIEWDNGLGGNRADYANSVIQASDGSYIVGGESASFESEDKAEDCIGSNSHDDFWVIKIGQCMQSNSFTSFPFTTHAGVKWNAVVGAVKYRVRYKPVGTTEWKYDYASDDKNHSVIKDLSCNTEYEWQVNTICATDGSMSSGYSASSIFTTATCRFGEIRESSIFKVYPNPASDKLFVELENYDENISMEIFDMVGNKIEDFVSAFEDELITIDISQLPAGVYILNISNTQITKTIQFIHQ